MVHNDINTSIILIRKKTFGRATSELVKKTNSSNENPAV
jgi:hypothetical protein